MKKTLLPPLIPFVLLTLIAEFLVREGFVRGYLVPAPSAILRAVIVELPAVRNNELRGEARLGQEMKVLLGAIEE